MRNESSFLNAQRRRSWGWGAASLGYRRGARCLRVFSPSPTEIERGDVLSIVLVIVLGAVLILVGVARALAAILEKPERRRIGSSTGRKKVVGQRVEPEKHDQSVGAAGNLPFVVSVRHGPGKQARFYCFCL